MSKFGFDNGSTRPKFDKPGGQTLDPENVLVVALGKENGYQVVPLVTRNMLRELSGLKPDTMQKLIAVIKTAHQKDPTGTIGDVGVWIKKPDKPHGDTLIGFRADRLVNLAQDPEFQQQVGNTAMAGLNRFVHAICQENPSTS